MSFLKRKLEIEAASDLFRCRISTVRPFALMISPVYIFLKRNEKFVSVKAPLDFFTPEELDHLSTYEVFHLPKAVTEVTPFQTAAKVIREMIKANGTALPPAPFELSFEILKVLGPLWGKELSVNACSSLIFTDELCGPLSSEALLYGRDTAVARHELGLLLSGLLVFVLVHLGWFDLPLLREVRSEIYTRTVNGEEWESPAIQVEAMARDLLPLATPSSNLSAYSLGTIRREWAMQMMAHLKASSWFKRMSDGGLRA